MGKIASYQDLDCYKLAKAFRLDLKELVIKNLPAHERFRLGDQLTRASRSVTSNIAEGYGKRHFKDKARYMNQAKGSVFELIDHLDICLEEHYAEEGALNKLNVQAEKLLQVLSGFERYLRGKG